MSPAELSERLSKGGPIHLIDVRDRRERSLASLPGALLFEPSAFEGGALPEAVVPLVQSGCDIVVMCQHGVRSEEIAEDLVSRGARAHSLRGGLVAFHRHTEGSRYRDRYGRHLLLREVGDKGQEAWRGARVLVVGAGGLGSPALLYLAAAGVGTLGIVDGDAVERSNLARQIVHADAKVGIAKTESAAATLHALSPDTRLELHPVRLEQANAHTLLSGYDVVLDATDNVQTRYLLADETLRRNIPLVHGAASQFEGVVTTFVPEGSRFAQGPSPCYRCLYPSPPSSTLARRCEQAGIFGPLCGVIGTLQAVEVLKILLVPLGAREGMTPLLGRLLTFDALSLRFAEHRFEKRTLCPGCGAT